jgi:hypothetical protein
VCERKERRPCAALCERLSFHNRLLVLFAKRHPDARRDVWRLLGGGCGLWTAQCSKTERVKCFFLGVASTQKVFQFLFW